MTFVMNCDVQSFKKILKDIEWFSHFLIELAFKVIITLINILDSAVIGRESLLHTLIECFFNLDESRLFLKVLGFALLLRLSWVHAFWKFTEEFLSKCLGSLLVLLLESLVEGSISLLDDVEDLLLLLISHN